MVCRLVMSRGAKQSSVKASCSSLCLLVRRGPGECALGFQALEEVLALRSAQA